MEKSKEQEELLKERIFSCFINSCNEPNRQQIFLGQLSSLIFNWCRDYLNFNINDMGVEIVIITKRLLNEKSKANIPHDKEGFIKYLLIALKRGKHEYIRNYEKKNQNDIIRMKESFIGRKLTDDERLNCTNIWFEQKISEDPNVDYLINSNTAIICDAVNSILERKQDRSRDCYRDLFTQYCIKKEHTEGLFTVLNQDIIDKFQKDDVIPTRCEIWQKYHSGVSKNGAEVQASTNLKNFLNDLEQYLKEKNPEIFHKTS